jgi:UDP-N-acetylglucosamine 2-epimerase
MFDPVGYQALFYLMKCALGVITDSGTVLRKVCVLGISYIQMRFSTEWSEVYEVGTSVRCNPSSLGNSRDDAQLCVSAGRSSGTGRVNPFGDGRASERILKEIKATVKVTPCSIHTT